jgi:hypothetical protein
MFIVILSWRQNAPANRNVHYTLVSILEADELLAGRQYEGIADTIAQ